MFFNLGTKFIKPPPLLKKVKSMSDLEELRKNSNIGEDKENELGNTRQWNLRLSPPPQKKKNDISWGGMGLCFFIMFFKSKLKTLDKKVYLSIIMGPNWSICGRSNRFVKYSTSSFNFSAYLANLVTFFFKISKLCIRTNTLIFLGWLGGGVN